jgi:hypothetical protein
MAGILRRDAISGNLVAVALMAGEHRTADG